MLSTTKILVCILSIYTPMILGASLSEKINVSPNKVIIHANPTFHNQYLREDFFASYNKDIDLTKLPTSIVTIPFIMNVIPIVWVSEQSYTIEEMDYDLFYALQDIKKTFQLFYPRTSCGGELIPKKLTCNIPTHQLSDDNIALLFSHGLDAIYSSLFHADKHQLLIMICGTDVRVQRKRLWEKAYTQCKQFALDHNQDCTFVKANPIDFAKQTKLNTLSSDMETWWTFTSQGLSYTSLTAPILYHYGYKHLLIAATFSRNEPTQFGSHPLIENNLRFAGVNVVHDGPVTLYEKVKFIKEWSLAHNKPLPKLQVCWRNQTHNNCNRCQKCVRTLVAILLNDLEPRALHFNITKEMAIEVCAQNLPQYRSLKRSLFWQDLAREADVWLTQHSELSGTKLYQLFTTISSIDYQDPDALPVNREMFTYLQTL